MVAVPAQAEDQIYPPIYDPFRPIKETVSDATPRVPQLTTPSGASGDCMFQGAGIEGFAYSEGVPETTGVVCRVFDQYGVQRGGCALFVNGAAASCSAPTEVVLGPPRVCVTAYATYSWGTLREEYCK